MIVILELSFLSYFSGDIVPSCSYVGPSFGDFSINEVCKLHTFFGDSKMLICVWICTKSKDLRIAYIQRYDDWNSPLIWIHLCSLNFDQDTAVGGGSALWWNAWKFGKVGRILDISGFCNNALFHCLVSFTCPLELYELISLSVQAVWVWTVSLPVTVVNASSRNPSLEAADIIGWIIWSIGISIEATADQQKLTFKNSPENRGKWCDVGVWKYSRHPNYFGEVSLQD